MDAVESVSTMKRSSATCIATIHTGKEVAPRFGAAEADVRAHSKKIYDHRISGVGQFFRRSGAPLRTQEQDYRNSRWTISFPSRTYFAALEKGTVALDFPIENSTGGVVIEAVEAMAAHAFRHSKNVRY